MTAEAANALRYEQDLLNKVANDNISLTPQQEANLRSLAEGMAAAEAETSRMQDQLYRLQEVASTVTNAMGRAFDEFVETGKFSFKDMVSSMLKDLARLTFQQALLSPLQQGLSGALGGLFGVQAANGAVLAGGNVVPFANGGVVNRPTVFPMARGAGLMGEAGPEAIMPLRRLSNGRLGVEAMGSRGGDAVNFTYAPTYNVKGSGPELDELKREMARDRQEFPRRVAQITDELQSRRMRKSA